MTAHYAAHKKQQGVTLTFKYPVLATVRRTGGLQETFLMICLVILVVVYQCDLKGIFHRVFFIKLYLMVSQASYRVSCTICYSRHS